MKKLITIAGLALSIATAQTVVRRPATSFNSAVVMVPGSFPTSLTCLVGYATNCTFRLFRSVTSTDPYLCASDITATTQTVTIQDSAGVAWINQVLGGGTTTTDRWQASDDTRCRVFPDGIYIQASAGGVTGSLTVKFNK